MLQELVHYLQGRRINATFMATHTSPVMDQIKEDPLFQIGAHPNFFPGSSQGQSEDEVFDYFNTHFPKPNVVRTHGVYQYGALFSKFVKNWETRYESSIFCPLQWQYTPFSMQTAYGPIIRAPFAFADDYLFGQWMERLSKMPIETDHPQVIMFHPVHWFLNTPSAKYYEAKKLTVHQMRHTGAEIPNDLKNNQEIGCFDVFDQIMQSHRGKTCFFNALDDFVS